MNSFLSLLTCICIVCVIAEFQSVVDGPRRSFAGEAFVHRLRRHAWTLFLFLERTFPSVSSSSSCEALMAGMDRAADKFAWVRLLNGRFRPGDSSGSSSEKKCCHLLWYAKFPSHQLYRGPWVGLKWAMVPMAPLTGGQNFCHAESGFFKLPPYLPVY